MPVAGDPPSGRAPSSIWPMELAHPYWPSSNYVWWVMGGCRCGSMVNNDLPLSRQIRRSAL